jgi:hypothetical protein
MDFRTREGNNAYQFPRPKDSFEPVAKPASEEDVILNDEVRIGIRMSEYEFRESEEPVRPEPKRLVSKRDRVPFSFWRKLRPRLCEDSHVAPPGQFEAL